MSEHEKMLMIEQRISNEKKSEFAAYLLWFFLGTFGVHRMYLNRWVCGFFMLALLGIGTLTAPFLIGYIPLIILGLWWVIDLFFIHLMIQSDADEMREMLNGRF